MQRCIACGSNQNIEFNHSLIVAGRQLNEEYCLQPLCVKCHRGNFGTIDPYAKLISELTAITVGLQDLLEKYHKVDWVQRKKWLESRLKSYLLDK